MTNRSLDCLQTSRCSPSTNSSECIRCACGYLMILGHRALSSVAFCGREELMRGELGVILLIRGSMKGK
jgi:hypothetical protein